MADPRRALASFANVLAVEAAIASRTADAAQAIGIFDV